MRVALFLWQSSLQTLENTLTIALSMEDDTIVVDTPAGEHDKSSRKICLIPLHAYLHLESWLSRSYSRSTSGFLLTALQIPHTSLVFFIAELR
jgi:hypothetical protein